MRSVTVDRERLLNILKENREIHLTEYNQAVELWRIEWQKLLSGEDSVGAELLDPSQSVRNRFRGLLLEHPTSFLHDYDDAISMLEMSVDESIVLDRHEFNQYVKNGWHQDWLVSNPKYSRGHD